MSRKKTEINPKRAENVKKLIEWSGITQIDFARTIHQTQQNVSRIINLKTALTEENAREIIKHFPGYRIEWLLGYDDYPTNKDYFLSMIDQQSKEGDLLNKGFFSYLELYGYTVTEASIEKSGNPISDFIHDAHKGVTISRDGKSVTLQLHPLIEFQNEIGEYIELRLKHMMK